MGLRGWLRLPETRDIADLDHPSATVLHGQIIRRKPFLRRMYQDFYRGFQAALPPAERHPVVVELGSGGGFIKEVIPHAITSDVLRVPGLDMCFSALEMPFADGSVDAIVMIDVLHHLPTVEQFFREADRCLKVGGKVLMVEPSNTLWGRFVYRNFHHEAFEPSASWVLEGSGPLSSANGALPWIVFRRDRQRFQSLFPNLAILRMRPHTPLRYLVSGGVSMRQLAPSFSYSLVRGLEILLSPADGAIGMFYTIELEKRG